MYKNLKKSASVSHNQPMYIDNMKNRLQPNLPIVLETSNLSKNTNISKITSRRFQDHYISLVCYKKRQ